MSWREDWLKRRVQAFREHVAELDEQERQARRHAPSKLGPARRGLPEGPGSRAARMLAPDTDEEAGLES